MNKSTYTGSLVEVIKREIRRITERRSLYILSFFAPSFIAVIFSFIFKGAVVSGIPVAVLDNDNSEISRILTRYIEASSALDVKLYAASIDEVEDAVHRSVVDGAFVFPKGMSSDIKSNKPVNAVVFINALNLIKSNYIMSNAITIIKTVSGGALLKKLRSAGLHEKDAMSKIRPVIIDAKPMFNANYSYSRYLVPGLVFVSLQMIVMMLSALLISSERENGTFGELIETSGARTSVVWLGKAIPHLLIQFINVIIILGVIFPFFDIELTNSIGSTVLFAFYFIITAFALGMFISVIVKEQMMATEIAIFINTPAFIFSGLTFPIWGMPELHTIFAQIIPFTHFLSGFLKVFMMEAPAEYLIPAVIKLSYFFIPAAIGSYFILYSGIKKSVKAGKES